MKLKYNYWYFTKAISPAQCQRIIKTATKMPYTTGTIEGNPEADKPEIDPKYRKVKITSISDPEIYSLLNPFIHGANKSAGWNFQWDWNETSQFAMYNKSDHYEWHHDEAEPFKIYNNKVRKLSLSLQLTDPSRYEGGDMQFRWLDAHGEPTTETVKKSKDRGTIIIFPSFVFHRITPIKKGTRLALINWSLGEKFK